MSQLIMFDLDGTLTESGPGITASVQYALDKMGVHVENPEELRCFVGPPLAEQFKKYAGFTEEQTAQAVGYYRERYQEKGIYENSLYPMIPELLEVLQINDKIIALATTKPEPFARKILEHFGIGDYFTTIVGSELDGSRTTKSEVIEEVLRRLGMSQERDKILMVGDREYDVLGARACGIRCVGVTYGYGTREELEAAGAVYIAESVEDLGILASPNDEETTEHVESVHRESLPGRGRKEKKNRNKPKKKERETETEKETGRDVRPVTFRRIVYEVWRAVYPILIHYGISLAVTMAALALAMHGAQGTGVDGVIEQVNGNSMYQLIVYSVLSSVILYFLYRRDQKRRAEGTIGMGRDFVWAPPVIWLSAIVLSVAVSQLLNDLIDAIRLNELFTGYSELAAQTMTGQPMWVLFLGVGILAPIAEELVFRCLVYRRLADWTGPAAAIVISALTFGLYHGNMVQFVYASLLGALFAFLYYRTGTSLTCIAAHMAANLWSLFGGAWWSEMTARLPLGTVLGILIELILCVVPAYWFWGYQREKRKKKERKKSEKKLV